MFGKAFPTSGGCGSDFCVTGTEMADIDGSYGLLEWGLDGGSNSSTPSTAPPPPPSPYKFTVTVTDFSIAGSQLTTQSRVKQFGFPE
jgi:hypothetical protein